MGDIKPRILVVDDERFNRNVLADLLKPEYTVVLAKNGPQGLDKAASANPPDLILLDIMMPEMDGYEVCRRLKDNPATRDIPVIFVTAMQQDEDEMQGLRVGAIDYIAKPFSPAIVMARVRNHIELKQAHHKIAEAHSKIATLLDNSGQGFLSFGETLLVDSEYSSECVKIFGRDIAAANIGELLFPDDLNSQSLFARNIQRVLGEPDDYIQGLYLSLLQKDFRVDGRYLEADYKAVSPERVMLILTDVTQERQLENAVRQERNRLTFIVSAVTDPDEFFTVIEDFETFLETDLADLLGAQCTPAEVLTELYRRVHTYKGLFAQLDFIHTPSCLHRLEQRLSLLPTEGMGLADLRLTLTDADCRGALRRDMDVIVEVLGESFFERKGKMIISKTQAALLERLAKTLLESRQPAFDEEMARLLNDFSRIRYINAKSLLDSYPKMALKLAERSGKKIEAFEIEGDDVLVHPDLYGALFRALVHVFRNAVDHGVETPEERVGQDKAEAGRISCRVTGENGGLRLEIGDDGRGLDPAAIRQRIVELGYADTRTAREMSQEKVYDYIFTDALSTRCSVTDISGRGVGLSSVKSELVGLGGEVSIETAPGKGTTFIFTVPLAEPS